MTDETARAALLAKDVLGQVDIFGADPDSDMAMLARQLLRAQCRWRCFHCGEIFVDEAKARDHFGTSVADRPISVAPPAPDGTHDTTKPHGNDGP